jgi:hypothetical protein
MTDNITVRRAEIERIRKSLAHLIGLIDPEVFYLDDDIDALAALDAALAEPEQKPEPVAKAWAEGYQQGVQDERISEASIGIAGFGAKVEPARQNPYAALPAPEPDAKPEPVAWMYVNSEGECEQIEYETPPASDDSITPLYAAPPEPEVRREPATNKEIDAEWLKIKPVFYPMDNLSDFRDGFRAAEQFHSITKEDKT